MPQFPTKFYCLSSDLTKGLHHLDKDVLAIMLTNTSPDQKFETPDQIQEVAPTSSHEDGGIVFGYPKGGVEISGLIYSSVNGITKVRCESERISAIIAEGEQIGPFRYIVVFNKTAGRLMCFHDLGGEYTAFSGEKILIDQGPDGIYSGV
jgi:hypothetical protein